MFLFLPTSFILLAPYPVSLLVTFALISWIALLKSQPGLGVVASCLAAVTHPTGIAFLCVSFIETARTRRKGQILLSILAISGTTVAVYSSGLMHKFLDARFGFSIFPGIPFWKQGFWYLTHHADVSFGSIAVFGTIMMVGLAGYSIAVSWKRNQWMTWCAVGLVIVSVLTGAWLGIPRFLIPAFIIPFTLQKNMTSLRASLLVLFGILQLFWLTGFVLWKVYV
jgi:hypothetical protein